MPSFNANCLWNGNNITIYCPVNNIWPSEYVEELETNFHGRLQVLTANGSDPYHFEGEVQVTSRPTETTAPPTTQPATEPPTVPTTQPPTVPGNDAGDSGTGDPSHAANGSPDAARGTEGQLSGNRYPHRRSHRLRNAEPAAHRSAHLQKKTGRGLRRLSVHV